MMKFDLLFVQSVVVSILLLVIVNVADPVNFVTGLQDDNDDNNHRNSSIRHHREIEYQHHHRRYLRKTASTTTSTSTSRDNTEKDVRGGLQQRGLQQGIEGVVLIRSSLCPLIMDSLEMGGNCIDRTRTGTTSTSCTTRTINNRRQVINGDGQSPVVHCGYDYVWMGGCRTASATIDDEEDEEEEDTELHCLPRLNCVCDLFGDGTWTCQTTADLSGVDCSDGTKAPADRGQSCPSSKQEQEVQETIIMLPGVDDNNKNNNVDTDSLLSIVDKDDVATSTIPATENEDGNNNNDDDIMQTVSGDNPDADDDYQVKGLVYHAMGGGGGVDDNDDDDDLSISSNDEDDVKDETEAIEENDNDVSTSTITATENEDGNDENDDVIQIVSGDNPEADDDYKVEISYVDATVVVVDDDDDDDTNSMSVVSDGEGDDDNNSCETIPELLCGEGSSVEKFTTVCDLWTNNFPDSNDKKTMTLFAPTDQAFQLMEELFSKGDNYSLSDEEYLEVFQFHVVPGRTVLFENLLCGELLAMSSKKFSSFTKCNIDTDGTTSAKIQRGGGNRKNNIEPMITTSDIRACHDSVIHIINEVMLPNFIDQFI